MLFAGLKAAERRIAIESQKPYYVISRRDDLLNRIENPKLKNAVNEMYRPKAKIGDGGLADAVRHELRTGELIGGRSHILKAQERISNLQNIISRQNLSPNDLTIAQDLLDDLISAVGGE
ncbi:hypothetical protein LJC32_05590 [Oscillospiraceae bacterium OttesenSCG-928-F05]|nr:hypothetical protein [Oscillospiraceae bacterium OttesenSCG-928-F05]